MSATVERFKAPPIAFMSGDMDMGEAVNFHQHRTHQLLLARSGALLVKARGKTYHVRPDQGVFIPAGTIHAACVVEATKCRTAFISPSAMPSADLEVVQFAIDEFLITLLERGEAAAANDRTVHSALHLGLVVCDEIELAIAMAEPGPANAGPDDPRIQKVCDQIDAHADYVMSIDEACRLAAMTRRSFTRLFRLQTGKTFRDWCADRRFSRSYARLVSGATVTEAALEAGYNDPNAFSTAFRRRFGTVPSSISRGADLL